uniref:Putative ribonuclease H-like domain-containing protein n=1 Tax=Tanacetum cinerariifolium TaxID=118510 RepID=A0A6L2MRB5_TANCI|nr:putative ribonuclease H-like domain-containing protein [Tanacetum cinerariifolium]
MQVTLHYEAIVMQVTLHDKRTVMQVTLHYEATVMQVTLHDKRIVMQVTLHYEAIVMQVTLHDKRIVIQVTLHYEAIVMQVTLHDKKIVVIHRPAAPIIEDWIPDSEDETEIECIPKQREPSFVKSTEHVKTFRESFKKVEHNKQLKTLRQTIKNTECVVLSYNYKLPDENLVLLRVPRENNMYNIDLKNVVPSGGIGPKWLFDIDTLTMCMKPVVAGNQPNDNAGIKENLDAGKVGKETVSAQQYILLPLWSFDSQDLKNTNDDVADDAF